MANLNPITWGRKTKVLAILVLALLAWGGWASLAARSETRVPRALRNMDNGTVQVINDAERTLTLRVKLAREQSQWDAGFLGAGAKVIDDTVILFTSTRNVNHRFTARGLRAPVDVAFFNSDGQLLEIQRMQPDSTRTFAARTAYRYALQARAGYFDAQGMSPGQARLVTNSVRTVR